RGSPEPRRPRVRIPDGRRPAPPRHGGCGRPVMALKLSAAVILLPLAVPVLGVHAPAQQLRPYRVIDTGVPIGQSPSAGVLARGLSPSGDQLAGVSVWEPFVWRRGVGMTALQKLG